MANQDKYRMHGRSAAAAANEEERDQRGLRMLHIPIAMVTRAGDRILHPRGAGGCAHVQPQLPQHPMECKVWEGAKKGKIQAFPILFLGIFH